MTVQSHVRLAAFIVALAFVGAPAMASQQGQRFAWWRSETVVKELGLTADQTARIEEVFQSMRQEARQELAELEELEAKLTRLIESDADEGVVVRQIDRVETARAALSKTRTLMLLRFRRVLSPGQRERLTALLNRWEREGRRPDQSPGSRR